MNITEEQAQDLRWNDDVYNDNNNHLFEVVFREITDYDLEHSIIYETIVIRDIQTNEFYRAENVLISFYNQNEIEWEKVYPKQITTTVYTN